MRKVHDIKILPDFADAILDGDKTFEIRENDRGYQRGDGIRFTVTIPGKIADDHPINKKLFEITYVINGWGLKNGCVAFAFRESEDGVRETRRETV